MPEHEGKPIETASGGGWVLGARILSFHRAQKPRSSVMRNCIGFSIVCLTCFLLVGAAKSDRYVKDNVFYSSSPKLEVKVDPKFKYLGKLDYTMEQQSPDNVQLVTYETKSYVFVDAIYNELKKAVYIQLRREQTQYVGNLLGDARANLRSGVCSLGEKEYQCFTRVIFLSADVPIGKFISEQGYVLPNCILARTYARADSKENIYLVVITYFENFSDSGLSCESWQSEEQLTEEHKQYLEGFDRNCKASFTIIKKESEKPGIRRLLGR